MATLIKFESCAAEYQALSELNLHSFLIGNHAHSTFFAKATGHGLVSRGIHDGDLLVVDRSLVAKDGDIVLASIDGEYCARVYLAQKHMLISDDQAPILIGNENDIQAVIPYSVRGHRSLRL
ncbi:S24 family peptidase [Vibrio agarivorans]|uniref:S24 family peptidase n=1 Tax=Vibrio agarivorans TaxID=153622 RepID=A0ABT7Y7B1_9VIBR|nr:S24 family peptidase [Vibrio agarivorans]MDN2483871.1 S24 family peptidase [Vibrio agarivorans]